MSYKSDGGRIPKLRDSAPQSRNMTSPVIQPSSRTLGHPVAVASRLPFLKPMGSATRSLRTSSFSDAERSGSLKAPSAPSRATAINKAYTSLLPRASTHPPPSTSQYTPTEIYPARPTPESAFAAIANQQPASTRERARNVLRRRAPTIGQSTDQSKPGPVIAKPGKLTVIIPSSTGPTYTASGPSQSAGKQTTIAKQKPFQVASQPKVASKATSQVADQGPRELASLRATSATQNLPPPTPVFASASSPSTRYSGSPGIWSRTSTPTSLSSYSPGIVHSAKVGPRLRHPSPSQYRLPVFSPSTQHSTSEDDWMDSAASGFPGMISGAESNISLLKDKHDGSLRMDDPPKAPTFSAKKIPQKMQTPSNLPRMTKAISAKSLAANQESKSRLIENHEIRRETRGPTHDSGIIPSRPSREGTHRLVLEPSPVIQSNLAPTTLSHKRRGSGASSVIMGGNQLISNPSAATSVDSLQSRASSRLPAPIHKTPEVVRKSPHILTKESKAKQDVTNSIKPKRFGLFPKTSKADMNGRRLEDNRSIRKGPAAGTGHEGYGRYTQRGRKSSVSSSDSRARSTSTSGTASRSVSSSKGSNRSRPDLDLDDFLLDRLEPVIITGGGVNGAALAKIQSAQSTSGLTTAAAADEVNPQHRTLAGYSTESLATSVAELEHINSYQIDLPLAATRATKLELPNPTTKAAASPNKDMSVTQDILRGEIHSQPGTKNDGSMLSLSSGISQNSIMASESPCQPDQRPKKTKGLKWSFFHRNGNAQKEKEKRSTLKTIETPLTPKLHATISPVSKSRPVAHYALVDTDSDPLEEIFHHLEESPPTEIEDSDSPVEMPAALNIRKPSQSILLPSPPKLHGEFCRDRPISPKVYFNKDPLLTENSPDPYEKRPRRLASVGRIPEVVSRRDRPHKPAMQSFSRPFSLADSPSIAAPVTNNLFELQTSSQSAFTSQAESPTNRPVGLGFNVMQPFGDPIMASALDFIAGPYSRDEFLAFSPRQDSMVSISSGSETLAAVTAVLPKPGSEPTEDEVWGEYDDLIDHVLSPDITKPNPFERFPEDEKLGLVTMASKALQAELNTDSHRRSPVSLAGNPTVALTPSSPQPSESSFHLRRSTIVSALHSSIAPSSQPSFSDIIASYCYDRDEKQTEAVDVEEHSISLAPVERQAAFLSSSSLNLSETFETCRQRNTVLFDIAERDREGPTAQTNIRSGSLMTSRWLSFGRVLFSPAHNHVRSGEQERILVIDGLGNDDWSFYCALTYPNADVYCLTDGPATTASKHPAAWQPPANHHTVYQASLEQQFPFSKGYFAVTVLRFPPVCPDSVQNNLVSECKRVLRPGGYMEMSLLDLDMVNMGIQTRKAVRNLKERTYLFDSSISLKPASDSIQKLLGRHGFDNLRRCMVRIPVTGVIVRSSGSSTSTSSSNPSTLAAASTPSTAFSALTSSSTSAQQSKWHGKSPSNDTDLSLGDLLSDPSPSPSNDESIRKIVTKVGRWWYTRCYEIPVLPNGDAGLSIWADKRVLRECQKRGTGFRLLIAYTQKPSEVKRRTASV